MDIHRVAEFGRPGSERDRLVELVLAGTKTATSSLAVEYAIDDEPLPVKGDYWTVIDSRGQPLATIVTVAVNLVTVRDIDFTFVCAEGEGFRDIAHWRAVHEAFWLHRGPEIAKHLGMATWNLSDDTVVVTEHFMLTPKPTA